MSLFNELKRRNVFRVAAAYVVVAWLVIQVVETIFPAFGLGDAVVRVVVILFAIGLLPAVVLAWVFEITPEGLKKEKDIDSSRSITPDTGKKLDRVIMVFLALALGYFAVDKFILDPARDETKIQTARLEGHTEGLVESYGDQSIAVLPFADMSRSKDQEYMSDGIAEELLNLLTKIPELRVISRSSAFSYKGQDVKLANVARDLNVAHVLDGSVRTADHQLRVTVQLINARSDTQLWSESYDRPLDNIFAIQDEIATEVVKQLKLRILGAAPKTRETDPAAYALFLRARFLRRQSSSNSMEQSQRLLQQVLEIDPHYLPALDDLATVYVNQAHSGERPFDEGYELARDLIQNGLEIDSDSGRMYAWQAWIEMYYDGDLQAAAKSFERALTLAPSDTSALGDAASFLLLLGRLDEAIQVGQYSVERDPVHPVAYSNLGNALLHAARFDEAIFAYRKVLSLSPGYTGAHYFLGEALLESGDPEAALAEMENESGGAYRLLGLTLVHFSLGNMHESDQALQTLIDEHASDWSLNIAQAMAFRGQSDAAFEWIDTAIESGHSEMAEINTNPLFKNLNEDPRWQALLAKLGKSPEQLDAIEFKVALPER